MTWEAFRTFADTYLIPIGAIGVGLGFWLLLGWVFGTHAAAIRAAVRNGCAVAGDALGKAGDSVFHWASWCFTRIEQALDWFGARDRSDATRPIKRSVVPRDHGEDPRHALSSTIVALGALVLLVFIAVNGYLMFEITPDLFSFSPEDVVSGSGKYIAWLVPIGVLGGEVIGGLLVKSEQRRRAAGVTEASVKTAWLIFVFCYLIELSAGVRRAWAFLWVASPFADEAMAITVDSAATAALWLVLAGGLPWVIFALAAFVEPVITRSNAVGRLITWVIEGFRTTVTGFFAALAVVFAIALFGGSGLIIGGAGAVLHGLHWLVRYVVLAVAIVLVVLCIQASWIVIQRIREWRDGSHIAAAVLLAIVGGALAGCGSSSTGDPGVARPQRTYAVVRASNLLPAPSSESFNRIATLDIMGHIGEYHKVVQVFDPKLHVCLADISASVRTPELRATILRQCGALVTKMTADQGPETAGVIIPIIEAGLTSTTPSERLDRSVAVVRCATNPPIPPIPTRSTIADQQVERIRAAYARAERDCSEQVSAVYQAARQAREEGSHVFVERVVRAFASRVSQRTDIIGTLRLVAEYVRTERVQVQGNLQVQVSVVSDLEDDANGCVVAQDAVRCPTDVTAPVRAFLEDPDIRLTIHQVIQTTGANPHSRRYAAEHRRREDRAAAWRAFWVELGPRVGAFTFIPQLPRNPTASLQDDAVGGSAGADTPERGAGFVTPPARGHRPPAALEANRADARGRSEEDTARPDHTSSCPGIETIRTTSVGSSLRESALLAYGRALAGCGPTTQPWRVFGITREAFADQYVITFVNVDAARGGPFAQRNGAQYQAILRAWNLE